MSYEINYEDQKFKDVEADKKQAISELDKTYSGIINSTDAAYKDQISAVDEWEKKQTQLQQEQNDFAIKKIEQQKDQAQKDYTKEQSGAYVDWQKQSNEFGAEAEQRAAQGLENTGFSESSKVSMFNAYQNRVAVARENHSRIVLDFANQMTQARLQNNAALAEIALNSLQKRLELNLQQLQSKNTLLLQQVSQKTQLEQMYYERWRDVLNQFNTEHALAEEQRQFDAQLAEQKRQFDFHNKLGEFAVASSGGGGGGGGGGSNSGGNPQPKLGNTKNLPKVDMSKSNTPASEIIAQNRQTSQNNLLNKAIAQGASKDNVSNAISLGVRNGTISKSEAAKLRQTFTPRGVQY